MKNDYDNLQGKVDRQIKSLNNIILDKKDEIETYQA